MQFVKYWSIFLWLNSKWLYRSSGKEEKSRCLVFKSSTKLKMRHFHVVVVYWRQRNFCTKKRDVRAKLLFCLSYPITFLPLSLPSPWTLLKLPRCNAKPSNDRKSSNSLKSFFFSFCSVSFVLFGRIYYITPDNKSLSETLLLAALIVTGECRAKTIADNSNQKM